MLSALEEQFLDARVEQYLDQMSTADKVGQLFVVAFEGKEFGFESDIAELIYLYRIGGVAISPRYLNFDNSKNSDTPQEVATLTNLLQSLAYGVSLGRAFALDPDIVAELRGQDWPSGVLRSQAEELAFDNLNPSNLPLLVAVQQGGNGVSDTALIRGFTQLPTQMAIGSTWQPEMARNVGQIVGRELNAVGINMLLGPDLNVFTQPLSEQVGRLGIRSFGRSPFWVSRMGRSYIQGIHEGGNNQVLTIARHFPGQGSSDRLPDQEIATIQETVEDLDTVHLFPFASVTRGNSSIADISGDASVADGLMSSHMRYGSLQGGADTKPLSLVPLLGEQLQREQFSDWREQGILMSDELGSPAIRRYYDAATGNYPIIDVVLSAFDAGHDLLYLSQFGADDTWATEKENIIETILHFQDRYNQDSDFAARIDQAVRRILRLKLRMYVPSQAKLFRTRIDPVDTRASNVITETEDAVPNTEEDATPFATETDSAIQATTPITATESFTVTFTRELESSYHVSLTKAISLPLVLTVADDLNALVEPTRDDANATIAEVVRNSFTLLYPGNMEELPQPPQSDDQILIITDSRLVKECETCIAQVVGPETLKEKIIELYGPDGRGLIQEEKIVTIGFSDLAEYFDKKAVADSALAESEEGEVEETEPAPTAEPEPTADQETATDGNSADSVPESSGDEAELLRRTEERFEQSNWIIFVMLDVVEEIPSSSVVKRFLGTDGELLRDADKNVVVLALNAPYFLDATEVSQLSAYFGVNSSTEMFLENAVSGLFQSETPRGAPVYNVPGTIYTDLFDRLKPDAEENIPLQLYIDEKLAGQVPRQNEEEEPEPIIVQAGQTVRLLAGQIIDKNGHVVPDDTAVEFEAVSESGESILSAETLFTRNGRASRTVQLARGGRILISAVSDPARSEQLAVIVEATEPELPDVTPEPTATADQDNSGIIPATPVPPLELAVVRSPNIFTLLVALLTILVMLSLLLILQIRVLPRPYLVQNMLWAMIVGLFSYIMYSAYLLYTETKMTMQVSLFGTAIVVFLSMLIPLLWLQLREE